MQRVFVSAIRLALGSLLAQALQQALARSGAERGLALGAVGGLEKG